MGCIVLCATGGAGVGRSHLCYFYTPTGGLRLLPSLPVICPLGSCCPSSQPNRIILQAHPGTVRPTPPSHFPSQSPGRHLFWRLVRTSICGQAWPLHLISWPLVSFPPVWAESNHSTVFSSPRGQGFLLSCLPELFVIVQT